VREGFLLALEGIDGSGTTTQAARLQAHLEERGVVVCRTAEPSTGPVGKLIRAALADAQALGDEALALLYAADRLDHLEREVAPALARGELVLTDRYLLSSLAYQSSYLPLAWVRQINARARLPDASVLLRTSPEVAADRRRQRGGDEERFDAMERQRRIAAAYERVFALGDVGATYAVDADRDLDTVTRSLVELIDELLAGRAREVP
jgi:dTMP kinase